MQSFSQLAMGQKLVEGDPKRQASNRQGQAILLTMAIAAILLWAGAYLAMGN